ncbi:MAG: rhomboid family intramembrane serine protease [Pseudomonadota bacterium]|nr:rhomboid family intramembrane serine protease [Pseudomonadota bacterium]
MERLIVLTHGAPAAGLLLLAIVVVSLVGLFIAPALIERSLFRPYWLLPRGEYATLVTSGFVHADLSHLLFNAITFWAFAFSLERTIGTGSFVALYAIGLLASDAGTWFKHRLDAEYRTLGASGAILAVLFASILYFPASSIFILPIPVPIPAPLFAVAYLAYTYYAANRAGSRINHDAHLSGALAGIAYVAITDPETLRRAWQHFAA